MSRRLYALCLRGALRLPVFTRAPACLGSHHPVETGIFITASTISDLDIAALCLSLWPAASSAQAVNSVQTLTSVSTTSQIWDNLCMLAGRISVK